MQTETFSTAIGHFDSLFTHFQELKAPISKTHISKLSLRTLQLVAPHLISPQCAKVYADWLENETILHKDEITRARVIHIIEKLEQDRALRLNQDRGIPSHLAHTARSSGSSNNRTN